VLVLEDDDNDDIGPRASTIATFQLIKPPGPDIHCACFLACISISWATPVPGGVIVSGLEDSN
jgi:hypothetical protein